MSYHVHSHIHNHVTWLPTTLQQLLLLLFVLLTSSPSPPRCTTWPLSITDWVTVSQLLHTRWAPIWPSPSPCLVGRDLIGYRTLLADHPAQRQSTTFITPRLIKDCMPLLIYLLANHQAACRANPITSHRVTSWPILDRFICRVIVHEHSVPNIIFPPNESCSVVQAELFFLTTHPDILLLSSLLFHHPSSAF